MHKILMEALTYLQTQPEDVNHDEIEAFKLELHKFHHPECPVGNVRWIPLNKVQANDYNPNSVPKNEMRLLHTSISHDGYTQPIVVIYDPEIDKYIIVDGFHRYTTLRLNEDIQAMTHGYVPCVVLDKEINDRMASTVRHNRARGKHSVDGMANMVFSMLDNGMTDEQVCQELGLEVDELLRLKHVTGFSKLFENAEYKADWLTRKQLQIKQKWKAEHPDEVGYVPKAHLKTAS